MVSLSGEFLCLAIHDEYKELESQEVHRVVVSSTVGWSRQLLRSHGNDYRTEGCSGLQEQNILLSYKEQYFVFVQIEVDQDESQ